MGSAASQTLTHLLTSYGYLAVLLLVGIESIGIPVPGETMLVAAALYAGTTHRLNILVVVAAAIAGAVIGDNIGFWVGREGGYRLLRRFGPYVGLDGRKLKVGQYLFQRYGGKVVFFGRFVALLRALAAFLAGANQMPWDRFLIANAAGGVVWAALFGFGGYLLGNDIHRILGPFRIVAVVVAVLVTIAFVIFIRRNEERLEAEAERAFPGPPQAPARVANPSARP